MSDSDKNLRITGNLLVLLLSAVGVVILGMAIYDLTKEKPGDFTEKNSVAVYFARSLGENTYRLDSVRRKIYESENRLEIAIAELLKGPVKNEKKLGYFSEIPLATRLIEIKETPQRTVINLSEEFEAGGGSSSMTLRLEQLINTVLDVVAEKPVYLEINGEQVKYIGGEGVSVPQPLSVNLNRGQDI